MRRPRGMNGGELVFLAFITVTGAFLRFYRIGKECLWFDEIYIMGRVSDSFGGIVDHLLFELGALFPPLYFFLLKVWTSLFVLSPAGLRSFSAFWGAAAVPVAYLLAREMFGRRAAVVASLLLAFSSFNVYYSQEAKMYAVWWTLVLISNLFFVRAVKHGARWPDLLPYAAVTAAALLTHNFPALVVFSQVIYLAAAVRPGRRGRWLLAYLLMVLLYLPWFFVVTARLLSLARLGEAGRILTLTRQGVAWIPLPAFKDFVMSFIIFTSGMKLYVFDLDTWSNAWHTPFPYAPTLCLLVLVFLLYPLLRAVPDRFKFKYLLGILIIFPCASVFIYSRTMRPLWHPRYLGFVSSLIFIAIGYGYSLSDKKILSAAMVGVLLALNLAVLDFYYSDRVKMPWDDLVVYLSPRVKSGATVLLPYVEMKRSLEYYWDLAAPGEKGALNLEYPYTDGAEIGGRVAECEDAWRVLNYSMPRGRKWSPGRGMEVPGYREERMYFGNGLEIIHYIREEERDASRKKEG